VEEQEEKDLQKEYDEQIEKDKAEENVEKVEIV
jgi:hypothetical protein